MHRKRLMALAGAAALSVALAAPAVVAADEPGVYVLDVFFCGLTDLEGNPVDQPVPAGSEIILFEGWIAATRGQVQSFVNNVTWVLEVDGEPVDVTPYLTGVIDLGPFWGDLFSVSAGTLTSGQTLETHHDLVLKSASFDGFGHYAKGSVYGGGVDCSVTAA